MTGHTGKQEIQLTLQEARLLKYLIEHKNTVVSRKKLLEEVWNISFEIETRTVDNFIVRLRKYFEPNPAKPVYFKSVRSVGYMFTG
jgi:DNA-binding response OmpR family regulator